MTIPYFSWVKTAPILAVSWGGESALWNFRWVSGIWQSVHVLDTRYKHEGQQLLGFACEISEDCLVRLWFCRFVVLCLALSQATVRRIAGTYLFFILDGSCALSSLPWSSFRCFSAIYENKQNARKTIPNPSPTLPQPVPKPLSQPPESQITKTLLEKPDHRTLE